jgi:DNA-binding LacI/PurR family transcriptional regulator
VTSKTEFVDGPALHVPADRLHEQQTSDRVRQQYDSRCDGEHLNEGSQEASIDPFVHDPAEPGADKQRRQQRLGFMMEIAAVAAAAALDRNLALVLAPPMESGKVPLELLDVDGALVIEPSAGDANLDYLRRQGLPVVTIGTPFGVSETVPHVDIHSRETTRLLLEHLHAQGARMIAMILGSAQRNSYVQARAAYEEFIAERGQPLLFATADEAHGENGGQEMAGALLAAHPEIDAFCVPVDAFAVGAVNAIRAAGRRIPEDVMVVTRYDGVRARTCDPPLTAVDLHLDQVAHQAIDLLFDHLRGDTTRRSASGPMAQLVPRQSSAKAARVVSRSGKRRQS